jgi:glycosyltransferase 2 family protein
VLGIAVVAMNIRIQMIVGIGVSLLCLYLVSGGVHLQEVLSVFSKLKVPYLILMIVVFLFSFVLRAVRWQLLLAPVKTISVHSLFATTMIGFMANNVLPLRAGEVIRGYALARAESISVSSALATLVVERLLDGIVISLFLIALLVVFPFPPWLVNFNYIVLLLYSVGVGVSVGLLWMRGKAEMWEKGFLYVPVSLRDRIEKIMGNFTAGLEILKDRRRILWIGLLSIAHWLIIALYYFLLFQACDIPLSFLAAVVLLVVLTFGIMLPAAPGYIGNFQYFTVIALSLFSVPKDAALGLSLVAHAGQFIPVTVIGLIYAIRHSLALTDFKLSTFQKVSLQSTES